jgi:two-component system phosphate regulon sensor histidine kinase PhoR
MTDALTELLETIPLPTITIDGLERICAANAEALHLLGKAIVGRNYVTMLRQPALIEAIEAVLRDGQPRLSRFTAHEGGQERTFKVTARVMPRDQLVVLCFIDITQLEQAGQMRRDFVANVSHELRTPLTALMGFIETLRGPARDDPAARERFLGIMEGETGRMNRLVGDLLSLSRVEDDERVRPRAEVDLAGVLGSVLRTLRQLSDEAGVTVEQRFGNAPVMLIGDQDQLMQVFTNIVENAIKYGASGKRIVVELERLDRDPALRGPGVRVHVRDFGPGIDEMHLPRLTERFYRADSHRSRALGGTGLGLAIVKHILNRHRGRLKIDSTLGEGATFTVILPLRSETGAA